MFFWDSLLIHTWELLFTFTYWKIITPFYLPCPHFIALVHEVFVEPEVVLCVRAVAGGLEYSYIVIIIYYMSCWTEHGQSYFPVPYTKVPTQLSRNLYKTIFVKGCNSTISKYVYFSFVWWLNVNNFQYKCIFFEKV